MLQAFDRFKETSLFSRFHLMCALGALGFAQPVLDMLAKNSEFLTVHQMGRWDVILLAFGLVFLPAMIAFLLGQFINRFHSSSGNYFFLASATIFLVMVTIPGTKSFSHPLDLLATAALFPLCGGLVYGLMGQKKLHDLWTWAALVPWIILGLFLTQPGPRAILFPPVIDTSILESEVHQDMGDTPVVLVVFDALPTVSLENSQLEVDEDLCPNLSAFLKDATWYQNALSLSDNTLLSVPSVLTGMQPQPNAQPNQIWHPYNLFTWLKAYRDIQAFESHTSLSRAESVSPPLERWQLTISDLTIVFQHLVLPSALRQKLPSITHDWIGFAQDKSDEKNKTFPGRDSLFDGFLKSIQETQSPACYFIHSLVPHTPYQHLPDGKRYTRGIDEPSGEGRQWGKWSDDVHAVAHSRQRHLYQVGYVDRMVGQILQELKSSQKYDDALIIFTADHGVSFIPGDTRRKLSPTNLGDILCVPLFVKYPGTGNGGIENRPVQLIDILPTVADVLDLPLPWNTDGTSLLHPPEAPLVLTPFINTGSKTTPTSYEVATILQQKRLSLQAKLDEFPGTGPNPSLANPLRPADLIGVQNPTMSGTLDEWTISLDGPQTRSVDSDPTALFPAVVSGTVAQGAPLPDSIDIAVLVDGRIAALTHPYAKNNKWSILLNGNDLPPGDHHLSLALVNWESPGSQTSPELTPITPRNPSCLGANLLLEERFENEKSGVYRLSHWGDQPAAWTNGTAHFKIVVPHEDDPQYLATDLSAGAPGSNAMAVIVDGHLSWAGVIPEFPFKGVFPLPQRFHRKPLQIDLLSSTHIPSQHDPQKTDSRHLGLVLANLALVDSASSEAPPPSEGWVLVPGEGSGVNWQGLYTVEKWGSRPVAWTRKKVSCELAWPSDLQPKYLLLDIVGTSPSGTDLTVRINGLELLSKESISGAWQKMVEIPDIAWTDSLVISLESSIFVPAKIQNSGDLRELGVALRQMVLIPGR